MKMRQTPRRDKKDGVKSASQVGATGMRHSVEAELSSIAGLERVPSRDPIHHLIEHSRELFDLIGRVNAEKMQDPQRERDFDAVNKERGGLESKKPRSVPVQNGISGEADSISSNETEANAQASGAAPGGEFYRRFSETAFSKGRLICAVEQNGGKTMMTSCIKRSIDQSPPSDSRQTEVRHSGATRMNVPDSRSKLSYHRYTRGALELVVDTAQNLTRTLQVFERMATGDIDDRLGLEEIDTAYRMYPFLNTRREKESLARYKEELKTLPEGSGEKKAALEFGINRLNSMISHKNRMRNDFYFQLRKILDNSKRAQELFSMPETEEEIVSELLGLDGDGGEGGDGEEN